METAIFKFEMLILLLANILNPTNIRVVLWQKYYLINNNDAECCDHGTVCYQWWSGHSNDQSYSQFFFYQICSKLVRFYFCGYYCCRCVLPVVKWTFCESVVLPVFILPEMFQACSFSFLWLLLLPVCATSCEVDIPWISRTPSFFFTRYVPSLFVFISVVIIVAGVCYRLWSGHSVNQSYSQVFFY